MTVYRNIRTRRATSPARWVRRVSYSYDIAQERAIEKSRTAVIRLTCGHITNWQDDEAYSAWRPEKGKSYCEKCGRWVNRKRNEAIDYAKFPDEPLF